MDDHWTIKEASLKTGLSIDTLHYYERVGLITDIAHAPNGHRRYCDADIEWILFLKKSSASGGCRLSPPTWFCTACCTI